MDRFFPNKFGELSASAFEQTALAPLGDFASRILIPRGIHMVPRGYDRDGGPGDDHSKGMGHKLTAEFLQDTDDKYSNGISVDQAIASALNPGVRQALTLSVGRRSSGVLGHISYSAPGRPVTPENNPWLAYRDFMGLNDKDEVLEAPDQLKKQSVLDLVGEEFAELSSANLSRADKLKLEMHFDSIRDLELAMAGTSIVACNLDATREEELMGINPESVEADEQFRSLGRMQMDVLALALACNVNRSATLQWGRGAGGPVYDWDGMNHSYTHHQLSHGTTEDCGGNDVAGYEDMLHAIDLWHMQQFSYLLGRLDAYEEAEGRTLLDNTVSVYANELADGKAHSYMDLPWLIAGGAGYFKQGEYIRVTERDDLENDSDAPHNKLLTMFMNAMGIPTDKFGGELGLAGEFEQLKA